MNDKTIKERYFTIVNKLGSVQRDATNPFAKAKYASLSNIQKHLAPLLAEQSCFLQFDFGQFKDNVYNVKLILYGIGITDDVDHMLWNFAIPIDNTQKNNVQAFGATTTYGQRYALCVAFQIALDDEDPDAKAAPQQSSIPAKTTQPVKPLPALEVGSDKYKEVVKWLATTPGSVISAVKTKYSVSSEVETQLMDDALNYKSEEV